MTIPDPRPVDVDAIAQLQSVQRARLSHLLRRIAGNPNRHPYTREAALVVADALAPKDAPTGPPNRNRQRVLLEDDGHTSKVTFTHGGRELSLLVNARDMDREMRLSALTDLVTTPYLVDDQRAGTEPEEHH